MGVGSLTRWPVQLATFPNSLTGCAAAIARANPAALAATGSRIPWLARSTILQTTLMQAGAARKATNRLDNKAGAGSPIQ